MVELDAAACETLRRNRGDAWKVIEDDVANVDGRGFAGVDLFSGGVPCPPFSIAGKQLGRDDERDLFPQALRLVEETGPRAVLLENVRGLAARRFDGYRTQVLERLASLGYQTWWDVVQASQHGVPQLRPRFVLVAVRQPWAAWFRWPEADPGPPPTVGGLLADLMGARGWPGAEDWARRAAGIAPTIVGGSKKHGGPDLGPTRAREAWKGLGVDGLGIGDDAPGPLFPADQRPKLTVRMVARLQGFPDSWEFSGRKTAAYRQVGNAFPPPVARALGQAIRDALSHEEPGPARACLDRAIAARDVAAAAGALLVLSAAVSVIGTVIIPRKTGSHLTRLVNRLVAGVFRLITRPVRRYELRDRLAAGQAAVILLVQLAMWLATFYVGFALLVWPLTADITTAFSTVGPALWTFGSADAHGFYEKALLDTAAMTALVTVTLQIAYLPTLYAAFNRRETEIGLLTSRAGSPSWGPELLARTYYALGSGTSTLDKLPELYGEWERWSADVMESHVTYSPLIWFRSADPLASWVTALLAVLDSAALYLSLCPLAAPQVPARLCLRSGLMCFDQIARSMGIDVPQEPDVAAGISLTYEEYLEAIVRLREMDFPIERDPAQAWVHFAGWRVNYERAAYAIAAAVDVVPALWSGPRRRATAPIPPLRPMPGQPDPAAAS